jgi:hypothetical protein
MRNPISGPAAQCQGLTARNSAISRALSFYPNFERLTEAERDNLRNDLVLMITRLQKAQAVLASVGRVEFSPHVMALMNFVGLA